MSYRAIASRSLPVVGVLVLLTGGVARGQGVTATATPGNINLNYVQGAALPSAQTVTVKSSAAGATYTTAIAPASPWLTASPDAGTLPAKVILHVNPTSLAVGTYTAAVTFTPVVAGAPGTAGTTNLKLVVTAPLPTLAMNPSSLTFNPNPPARTSQTVQVTTTGGPVSFSASAGTASWLSVSPTSGVVVPGGPVTLTVTADPATVGAQVAAYTGKITLTETGAASKTQTIAVSFTVNYQTPTVTSIWPPNGKAGGPATTITLRGTNFGAATVAKIQGPPVVPLSTTYYSPTAISAVIPAAQLATGTPLVIYVSNPAPGGDSVTTVTFGFGPTVDTAVNAASYAPGGSPGGLITLFGENIGPTTTASLTMTGNYVDSTLGGISVTVGGIAAPMVYVSQNQISVQVPYAVALGVGKAIVVTNGGVTANGTIDITATSPGIFTVDASGAGQAAALNTIKATGAVSINSASNAIHVGDVISLYLTGQGAYTPASIPTPVDGYVIPAGTLPAAMPVLAAPVTVTIGGVAAPADASFYAGPFDGGMLGVLQVNATVPAHTTGTAVPVVVTIGASSTPSPPSPTATISTKP